MRPPLPRLSPVSRLGFFCALVAAAGLLGACDGHPDKEAPEGYGHGSSHADSSYTNHEIDSQPKTRSFSDTRGTEASEPRAGGEKQATPAASPGAGQPGRFFPSGS